MLGTEDLAALASQLRQQTDLTPERAAYLDRLAAQVRSGEYTIDTEKLANRLVDDMFKQPDDPRT